MKGKAKDEKADKDAPRGFRNLMKWKGFPLCPFLMCLCSPGRPASTAKAKDTPADSPAPEAKGIHPGIL